MSWTTKLEAPLKKWHIIYTNQRHKYASINVSTLTTTRNNAKNSSLFSHLQRTLPLYHKYPYTIHPMLLNSSFISLPSFFKSQELGRTNLLIHRNGSPLLCYATNTNVSQRKSANYQPNIWNYDILQSLKHDYEVILFFFIKYSSG